MFLLNINFKKTNKKQKSNITINIYYVYSLFFKSKKLAGTEEGPHLRSKRLPFLSLQYVSLTIDF